MKSYLLRCLICKSEWWIRGFYDPSVNATELDDNDSHWKNACEHSGEYEIVDEEVIDDGSYETTDHGDSVWPR